MSGLPTIEQVREHAERHPAGEGAGLWRMTPETGDWPAYYRLRAGGAMQYRAFAQPWRNGPPALATSVTWTPCDRDGNPVALVDELIRVRAQAQSATAQATMARHERDHAARLARAEYDAERAVMAANIEDLRAANERLTAEVERLQR